MKKLFTILVATSMMLGLTTTNLNAQDSTQVEPTKSTSIFRSDNFSSELTLASRNVFRGVSYGESPSIMMKAAWMPCSYFELGVYGNMTLNGTKKGYGNQVNYYATLKPFAKSTSELKNLSITSDDFFYFNSDDSLNNYMEFGSEKTQHAMEARLKYDGAKLDLTVACVYYANKNANMDGIYIEAGYDVSQSLNIFVGYLTDQSDLMFQSEGGFTNVGFTVSQQLNVKEFSPMLKTSLVFSPTYKTIYDLRGVGHNPVSLVASLTF